ncbi:carbohydrate porin [Gracilimonas sp.]|uniref:carbohydrate porin n=1 Tax=Gracilimonas sp. TaxID=1974203 RepID=UPI002870F87D|nr:carbohydrate porin [Gracilimonas sp.]
MKSVLRVVLVCFTLTLLVYEGVQSQTNQEDSPFKVSVSYTGDVFGNVAGGLDQGVRYFDNIDVNMEVNFGELPLGLDGTTFYIYGLGNQGGSITSLTSDLQGTSNIEAENSWRIFEAWAQKKFFLANSSILFGLYDINSEFNALNSSLLFLNSSHGLDPTIALSGELGPSTFPYTSLAARFKINPYKGLVVQGAVLDGVPSNPDNTVGTKVFLREEDGFFLIGEASLNSVSGENLQMRNRVARLQNMLAPGVETDNKIAFGGWYYSKENVVFGTSGNQKNEWGVYTLGEYELYSGTEMNEISIKIFGRAGWANPDLHEVSGYLGGGIVADALFSKRPNDKTGIAIAYAAMSSSYIDNIRMNDEAPVPEKAETNIELTHQFALNDYVQIQANAQYIINPGASSEINDAFVAGTRLIIGF